ncbi:ABC transporter substrate-binding protein [Actinoalloteichus sp. AHMU CJ021]|uniref:Carbohydrate ABC transporter substrate-binding protein, CUT1 family (TC 3.A.1.1.-) n=1 Tax=Actinoalloteichus caeruleus DSM 43889 TaxID=1120930 RepID=A0ABT1JJD4_ACTCY|nr:ABC transporter substrate-binding protein [Actinoalloteichus caeruleus]AUS78223.1 ABC transporter substrate-binding protein [Actinoalloteichus sp. AHMU CJ021]MCP2332266.1 carbohydrate ABC transporter substrate-binding protein, CUT1 family (TC 3.A.1.1.-) [Actinoalloteichus caeruleus DSM 43889]
MGRPAMRARPGRAAAAMGVALLAIPLAACGADQQGITVNLYYAPEDGLETVVENCNQRAAGRYQIVYNKLPRGADDQRLQMVRRLAAEDRDMDVLGLDLMWTQEFAGAEWIQEWTGEHRAEAEEGTLEGPLESARYEDRLYAAPKNTNVQLLWYRTDLVDEPPETWDDMMEAAQELKDAGDPHTILITGAQYEGLVVHYNSITASAGGHMLSEDGLRAEFDEGAVRALQVLRDFATSGLAHPGLTNAMEDDARLAFQTGNAAFQINWPFVYAAMQAETPELAQNVGWAPYPGVEPGSPSRSTIGGYNLAVSTYSEHPDEAFDAALCLRNAENQKFSAINSGVPPTIESVYDEPEMLEAYPMKDAILESVQNAANRPSTPAYQNVSTVLSHTLSPPSAIDPERTAEELRVSVQKALESKGVLP